MPKIIEITKIERPRIEPIDKDRYRLYATFRVFGKNDTLLLNIAPGFETNGADIPRIFWSIWPPNSPAYIAAVIAHDFLYEVGHSWVYDRLSLANRYYAYADRMLLAMMLNLGVCKVQCYIFYFAVRLYSRTLLRLKNHWLRFKSDFKEWWRG